MKLNPDFSVLIGWMATAKNRVISIEGTTFHARHGVFKAAVSFLPIPGAIEGTTFHARHGWHVTLSERGHMLGEWLGYDSLNEALVHAAACVSAIGHPAESK